MTAVLEVAGLSVMHRRPDGSHVHAVDGVSLQLSRGRVLGIVGESGSGKTTLARVIIGAEKPTSGTAMLNDIDVTNPPKGRNGRRERSRLAQMVFQDPLGSLDVRQTISAALNEVLRLHGTDTNLHARRRELAELVGLDARLLDRHPGDLSGGQRQRAAIARALAVSPALLILDEAVAALDVSIQAQIINVLLDIRDTAGIELLLISHDLAVVRQMTDDVVVMQQGRVVESGPTERVIDHPGTEYTKRLIDSVPRAGWNPTQR